VPVTDLFDIARTIEPEAAEPYLRAGGWELVREGKLGNRWRLREDTTVRNVAVPLPALDEHDRAAMLVSVLETLADIEHRSPVKVARDLRDANNDLLEFRVVSSEIEHGEIPLRAAPELTQGAFEAIQAAARSAVAPRPHYAAGTLPAVVRRFVDDAKLAGTEKGSVVLVIRAPMTPVVQQESIEGLEEPSPFERRVVDRLVHGVRAAKAAAHRDLAAADPDSFDEDIGDGLSANLCEALSKLAGEASGLEGRLDLRVRWALTRPSDERSTTVEVERGELGRLDEIATVLKQIQPIPNTTVRGPVVRLARQPGEPEGTIDIQADIDGRTKVVRMHLERSDYDLAWTAQSTERELEATGILERAGQIRELTHVTWLQVVGPA
jgi:hypothetical protein